MQKQGKGNSAEILSDEAGLLLFYERAYDYARVKEFDGRPFMDQIEWQRNVKFEDFDATRFFFEYVWVVLASGFKVDIARPYLAAFTRSGKGVPEDCNVDLLYKNERKKVAVRYAQIKYKEWFADLQKAEDKLAFLETLYYIGPVTKFHLSKSIGLEYAKPDVHLVRLCKKFGYPDAQALCQVIAQNMKERISVVDLVLWFYCSRNPSYKI